MGRTRAARPAARMDVFSFSIQFIDKRRHRASQMIDNHTDMSGNTESNPMILYKYVSASIAEKILTNGQIRFTQPNHFNDPFDQPRYPKSDTGDPVKDLFSSISTSAKDSIWGNNTGILSLTRTPFNALMWSHYADEHRGAVIGIDIVCAGLTDSKTNLIPAQFGGVLYASRRPSAQFIQSPASGIVVGATHSFPADHYEKLQRLFLTKPICWSYEEEVRVVKCINGLSDLEGKGERPTLSGLFTVERKDDDLLFLFGLPTNAIKEVYIGFHGQKQTRDAIYEKSRLAYPDAQFFECDLDDEAFGVGARAHRSIADIQSDL